MELRKLLFLVSLLAIALYVHLPSLSGKDIKKILLEEVLSIGSLEDDALFQWVGVISDSDSYIYVTDNMDYSLKKFDDQGNLIKKTGQKGKGPGEFL
ncbi:MAG TPA: 6-bladed beta-propeller, partial [Candidatus Aminicenantes bacterium]|nr:6-bladed beta-propeller [Candidatus Aminicenantes bacterium]